MVSKSKKINNILKEIVSYEEKLIEKRNNLKEKLEEKYPWESYGITSQVKFDEQSKELDEEIKLIGKYKWGFIDLIEINEKKRGKQ